MNMLKQHPDWARRALLACVVTATCGTAGAAALLDQEKLRILSCNGPSAADVSSIPTAERRMAVRWLNASAVVLPNDAGLRMAGPIHLGKACLKNVTITGSFGVRFIQGEICNARLDDFTDTLAAAGTALDKIADEKLPGVMLEKVAHKWSYRISRSLIDMRTGKQVPTSEPHVFMCSAAAGGHQ